MYKDFKEKMYRISRAHEVRLREIQIKRVSKTEGYSLAIANEYRLYKKEEKDAIEASESVSIQEALDEFSSESRKASLENDEKVHWQLIDAAAKKRAHRCRDIRAFFSFYKEGGSENTTVC